MFAEDNYLVREGAAALLATADDLELVATVSDLPELLAAVEELAPDAVLTDIRMPPTGTNEGIEAAKEIRSRHPAIGVVVLSQFAEEEYAYVVRDARRIVRVGGSLVAVLAVLFVLIDVLGIIRF